VVGDCPAERGGIPGAGYRHGHFAKKAETRADQSLPDLIPGSSAGLPDPEARRCQQLLEKDCGLTIRQGVCWQSLRRVAGRAVWHRPPENNGARRRRSPRARLALFEHSRAPLVPRLRRALTLRGVATGCQHKSAPKGGLTEGPLLLILVEVAHLRAVEAVDFALNFALLRSCERLGCLA